MLPRPCGRCVPCNIAAARSADSGYVSRAAASSTFSAPPPHRAPAAPASSAAGAPRRPARAAAAAAACRAWRLAAASTPAPPLRRAPAAAPAGYVSRGSELCCAGMRDKCMSRKASLSRRQGVQRAGNRANGSFGRTGRIGAALCGTPGAARLPAESSMSKRSVAAARAPPPATGETCRPHSPAARAGVRASPSRRGQRRRRQAQARLALPIPWRWRRQQPPHGAPAQEQGRRGRRGGEEAEF